MNIINKRNLIFFSIATLMINGCVVKNEPQRDTKIIPIMNVKSVQKSQNTWRTVKTMKAKDKDCIDCYASGTDYSKAPSVSNNTFAQNLRKPVTHIAQARKSSNQKHDGSYGRYPYNKTASDTTVKRERSYTNNTRMASPVTPINTAQGSYTIKNNYASAGNTAIQVGAFRKYSGATQYVKRYEALSDRYNVAIKKGTKNGKPLYRVRIEGFNNNFEAKKFMNSYGISDGFLVRK